jgi:anti-anti-sigma factor
VLDIDVFTDEGPGTARVRVAGELDIATGPALETLLRDCQQRAELVVLDLRELSFMDLAGTRLIVDASRRARMAMRRLVLVRPPPQVDRIFTLTGSHDTLEFVDAAEFEVAGAIEYDRVG